MLEKKIRNVEEKLEELLRNPTCTFVLYVGKKKLIKRTEFEKYILDNVEI